MDDDVLGWVVAALKESLADEKKYYADHMAALQAHYDKLRTLLYLRR